MVGTKLQLIGHGRRVIAYARAARPGPRRQGGAIAVLFSALLLVIVGFCGLALDMGQLYNRKTEIQSMADAVALAAARELNGTGAGVDNALAQARTTAESLSYQYNNSQFEWSDRAIKFGSSADPGTAGWLDAAAAKSSPQGVMFVKVDTADLDLPPVETVLMHVLSPAKATAEVKTRAVAGRSSINVTPLAICAMSAFAAEQRGNELVQFGFRRGVSYDLMQLNPDGTAPQNFLVNPVSPPGVVGTSVSGRMNIVRPFICTGTMAVPNLTGGAITVERPFPLASLYEQLNSRFGTYAAPCTESTAPPDYNVKPYTFDSGAGWMTTTPSGQTAESTDTGNKLRTVADLPGAAGPTSYGPLWAYARAVRYSSYVPGAPEPANGYAKFNTSDWQTLYATGVTAKMNYPGSNNEPYDANGAPNRQAPPGSHPGVRDRRVLHVPLLQCPVAGGTANVVGIAKFFMTVPATDTALSAEFAGLVSEAALGGKVELYP